MLLKQSILEMRAYEAAHADFHNKKYDKLTDKICEAQDKIKSLVPKGNQEELRSTMLELESAMIQSSTMEQKEMYRQGFSDGLEIAARLLRVKI